MVRYQIVSSQTDGKHRVWDDLDQRIVSVHDHLVTAQLDAGKRNGDRRTTTRRREPAPASLELTAQDARGGAKRAGAESPTIVKNTDGYRVWRPDLRIFVGRAGGGAMQSLPEAQDKLREILESQLGLTKPPEQFGLFGASTAPAPSAGPLFKMNGAAAVRRGPSKGNPMGDHLGEAQYPRPPRRPADDESAMADVLGGYFMEDYQGAARRGGGVAPGRRSAKRNDVGGYSVYLRLDPAVAASMRQDTDWHRVAAGVHLPPGGQWRTHLGQLARQAPAGTSWQVRHPDGDVVAAFETARGAKVNDPEEVIRHRGEHSDGHLTSAQIAAHLRSDIKNAIKAGGLPAVKLSIKSERYSMGQAVRIRLVEAPFQVVNPARVREVAADRFGNSDLPRYTPRTMQVLSSLNALAAEYIRSDFHGPSDLNNTNCFIDVNVSGELEDRERAAILAAAPKPNGRATVRPGAASRQRAARATVARFLPSAAR